MSQLVLLLINFVFVKSDGDISHPYCFTKERPRLSFSTMAVFCKKDYCEYRHNYGGLVSHKIIGANVACWGCFEALEYRDHRHRSNATIRSQEGG